MIPAPPAQRTHPSRHTQWTKPGEVGQEESDRSKGPCLHWDLGEGAGADGQGDSQGSQMQETPLPLCRLLLHSLPKCGRVLR